VYLDGERVPLEARVTQLTGYSAHADSQGLIDWAGSMKEKPGSIKLVHGEPEAQQALKEKFTARGYDVTL
jgi:metallo-beta-lactamase family protein